MKPLGHPVTHFWKVNRMARVTGVDLSAAHEQGDMSSAEWADVVTRCRGCEWTEGCERFLQNHVDGDAEPPKACANHDLFKALKP